MAIPIRPTFNADVALEDLLADEKRRKAAEDWAMKRGGMAGDALDAMPFAWEQTGGRFQDGQDMMHEAPASTVADRFRSLGDAVGAIQQRLGPDGLNRYARGMDSAARVIAGIPGEGIDALPQAKISGAKQSAAVKPALSTDPNSPESKRAQAEIKMQVGDQYTDEEIAQVPESRAADVIKYGTLKRTAEVTREGHVGADKRQQNQIAATRAENELNRNQRWAQIFQAAEQFGASQDFKKWLAEQELAEKKAAREDKAAEKAAEASVPGFEPAPGATPVKSDAEAMKKTTKAAARMRRGIADLRALHAKYGSFPKGTGATLQQQSLRAIQLEAKNIAELGALSGPDFELMQDISAGDLNSLPAFLQRSFGGASLEDSLQGLERWMDNNIAGTAEGLGYQPKRATLSASKSPQRVPATSVLPTDASGTPTLEVTGLPPPPPGKVRVRIGKQVGIIPRENLEKAKKEQGAVEVQ